VFFCGLAWPYLLQLDTLTLPGLYTLPESENRAHHPALDNIPRVGCAHRFVKGRRGNLLQ